MATTDAKPGFRLPWSADRSQADQSDAPAADAAAAATPDAPTVPDVATPDEETESPAMIDAAPAATTSEAAVDSDGSTAASTHTPDPAPVAPAAATPARKPNKFMADLTKAMQSAAESARADSIERLSLEAKTTIEAIHADSASEATDLRKRCDDDVAAVREWSKTEIARIREETDERIVHRKNKLERQIEEHAAEIEARIERVQARVTAFETEMAAFFERLLGEDDPTRFAAMAESLPEPPSFDSDEPYLASAAAVAVAEPVDETPEPVETVAETEAVADEVSAEAEPTGWESTTPETAARSGRRDRDARRRGAGMAVERAGPEPAGRRDRRRRPVQHRRRCPGCCRGPARRRPWPHPGLRRRGSGGRHLQRRR